MENEFRDILKFISIAGKLKSVTRCGWVQRKIPSPESVADHTFRLCLLVFVICKRFDSLDKEKCFEIALIHDLAESIVGDITPKDGISKEKKFRIETDAFLKLTETLGDKSIMDLWLEYERLETEEARLVKDLDVIEAVMQAMEYSRLESSSLIAQDFIKNSHGRLLTKVGEELLAQLVSDDWTFMTDEKLASNQ